MKVSLNSLLPVIEWSLNQFLSNTKILKTIMEFSIGMNLLVSTGSNVLMSAEPLKIHCKKIIHSHCTAEMPLLDPQNLFSSCSRVNKRKSELKQLL